LGEAVEIETVTSGGLWHAFCDPSQLENALVNLALNARDAMPGGGKLTLEAGNARLDEDYAEANPEVQPGRYVIIAVTDTGCGMAPAVIEHAFEPFFTTKNFGKGSGLGLSMVYGFVTQSRGYVRIHSELGHGTSIELYLPGLAADAEIAGAEPRLNSTHVGSEKILVVEDDDLVLQHVMMLLKSLGYQATSARNGAEALAMLETTVDFELLLTDVVMPGGINGYQLAHEARKLYPALPVLLSSGYTDATISQTGSPHRNFHLLKKPYRRQDLATHIRTALGREGVEAQPLPD
jgi:CheY-like chemotaxis protein